MTEPAQFLDDMRRMARFSDGHIFIQTPDAKLYFNGHLMLAINAGDAGSAGCMSPKGTPEILRDEAWNHFVRIKLLLEAQGDYDPEKNYCAVVTDWPERGEDIALYVGAWLDEPIVPMIVTPAQIDGAFRGPPAFRGEWDIGTDGNHRSHALGELLKHPK